MQLCKQCKQCNQCKGSTVQHTHARAPSRAKRCLFSARALSALAHLSSIKPLQRFELKINHSVIHKGRHAHTTVVASVVIHVTFTQHPGDRSRRCNCDRNLKLGAPYKLGAPLARSRPCLCSPAGGRTPEASSLGAAQLTVREPHLGHRVGHLTNGLDEVQGRRRGSGSELRAGDAHLL